MIDSQLLMGCVCLRVADLEKITEFYATIIGLRILEQDEESITLGTAYRRLVKLRSLKDGIVPRTQCGLFHLALRVSSRAKLAQWVNHYTSQGSPYWQGASDHSVSEAFYLKDPERNGIEIYCDRPESTWTISEDGKVEISTQALDLESLGQEDTEPWPGYIDELTDMGHVHLKVNDTEVAKEFYHGKLGFGLKAEMEGSSVFVAAGNYHHHLGLSNWYTRNGGNNEDNLYGLGHYELIFDSREKLDIFVNQVSENGIQVNTDEMSIRDPFNNLVLLRSRN